MDSRFNERSRRDGARAFLAFSGFLLLFSVQATLGRWLGRVDTVFVEVPPQRVGKIHPMFFQLLSFGQLPVAIDWLWIRTVLDTSMIRVSAGEHAAIFYDLDLITDLDPMFFDAYVSGANVLAVIHSDGGGALHLLKKGDLFRRTELAGYPESFRNAYWWNAWLVPLTQAYVYLFELDNLPSAAQAFEDASRLPGAPEYLQRLVTRFKAPGGQFEVGLKLLTFLAGAQKEPEARDKLFKKRDSLAVAQFLFHLRLEFEAFSRTVSPLGRGQKQRLWDLFVSRTGKGRDPWGGTVTLAASGLPVTTTPHDRVFGIE